MNKIYDAIIIGGGPAGLSAAIYMARAKFSVLVIEKEKFGGQITITNEVVNYPGVFKTSGKELTENMRKQAQSFGAQFLLANVKEINLEPKIKKIVTDKGIYESVGVILATGSSPRKIGFINEEKFQGRGVAYCATCDGEFFTGKNVFVIGGGFAAAEEAIFLTKYARKVHIIVREDDFTCAKSVADKAKAHPQIEISYNTEIIEVNGEAQLKKAVFKNNKTGMKWTYEANEQDTFGVFVFAGYKPATDVFKNQVELSESGNLITDMNQKTNIEGVYGAGDVCVKNLRQVVTAVSDGAIAATSLEKYIPEVVKELKIETIKSIIEEVKVEEQEEKETGFITASLKTQLSPILNRLTKELVLVVEDNNSSLSKEMISFVKEFVTLSPKLSYEIIQAEMASIKFYDSNKQYRNVCFHAVPGGHEFNSFVIAVYNAIGPKQPLEEKTLQTIHKLSKKTNIKVIVSLSCTMCPEVVMATQRIALENKNIEAEVYDFAHYPALKEKYNIMSVPAMIINEEKVYFGKKDIQTILSYLQ